MVQQTLFLCGLAMCWHLAIGYWAISTVSRVRNSALDADRHIENLQKLQRLVSGIERQLHALAAIEERRQQSETIPGFGRDGRGPCTCNEETDDEWIWRSDSEELP